MDWFQGQLQQIFGIPQFWVARIAKLVQFGAGLVILIEIIGKERIESIADKVRSKLSIIIEAKPLRAVAAELCRTSKFTALGILFWFLMIFSFGLSKRIRQNMVNYTEKTESTRYDTRALVATTILAILGSIAYLITQSQWGINLLYEIPVALLLCGGSSMFLVYIVALNLLLFLIYIVFRPSEWVFDFCANIVLRMIQKKGLSQLLLIISLFLFIIGFILELLAS